MNDMSCKNITFPARRFESKNNTKNFLICFFSIFQKISKLFIFFFQSANFNQFSPQSIPILAIFHAFFGSENRFKQKYFDSLCIYFSCAFYFRMNWIFQFWKVENASIFQSVKVCNRRMVLWRLWKSMDKWNDWVKSFLWW